MAVMTWSETYSVGSATIDSDHRILIDLINQLHDAMDTGQSRDVVGSVVNVLAEYVEQHFRREERLMVDIGYPHAHDHAADHRRLEKKVCRIRDRWLAGDRAALDAEVMTFLGSWLQDHILGTDRSYRPWIDASRPPVALVAAD